MSKSRKSKPGGCLVTHIAAIGVGGLDTIAVFVRCREHPYYRAIRQPRVDCYPCQMMYTNKKDPDKAPNRRPVFSAGE